MNRQECMQILTVIKAHWSDFTGMNNQISIESWYKHLSDKEYRRVLVAVDKHIATSPYAPKISDINNALVDKTQQLGEMQAWDLVRRAVSNSTYNAKSEYDKLPEEVQQAIGSYVQLKNWAMSESKELETVGQSNFMRAFREKSKAKRDYEMLPTPVKEELKQLTDGLANKLSLNKPNE